MTRFIILIFIALLTGCVARPWTPPMDFVESVIKTDKFDIFTYTRINNNTAPIHIYIEGDGNSFDAYGMPTSNPTPHGTFIRELAAQDTSPNVVYMARPCQYIMSAQCNKSDWTYGRFSPDVIESTAIAIRKIAKKRPVVLIGYSGGAMISGLVIQNYPDINVQKWITVAGVLNHADWTEYFGDSPLTDSENLTTLPRVPQIHYIADRDHVVPNELSRKWVPEHNLVTVPNSTHHRFENLNLKF